MQQKLDQYKADDPSMGDVSLEIIIIKHQNELNNYINRIVIAFRVVSLNHIKCFFKFQILNFA